MVQKRLLALLSACLTTAVVALSDLDWIGRERSMHDADRVASYTKFLLAGTVLVSYMVTVSFVQVRQRVDLGLEHLPVHSIIPASPDTRWVPGPALGSCVLGVADWCLQSDGLLDFGPQVINAGAEVSFGQTVIG